MYTNFATTSKVKLQCQSATIVIESPMPAPTTSTLLVTSPNRTGISFFIIRTPQTTSNQLLRTSSGRAIATIHGRKTSFKPSKDGRRQLARTQTSSSKASQIWTRFLIRTHTLIQETLPCHRMSNSVVQAGRQKSQKMTRRRNLSLT